MIEVSYLTLIVWAVLGFGFVYLVCDKLSKKAFLDQSFDEVDQFFKQEWNGEKNDELMAWYRVRRRLLSNKRASKDQMQGWIYALETRIDQCRERNSTFKVVDVKGGRPALIHNQN